MSTTRRRFLSFLGIGAAAAAAAPVLGPALAAIPAPALPVGDTEAGVHFRGDNITGTSWQSLPTGRPGQILTMNSGTPEWANATEHTILWDERYRV